MDRQNISSLGFEGLTTREWLATNRIGGFASSTLAGLNTRKYHGLLVASMSPPVRRMVILSRVQESIQCAGRHFELGSVEYPGTICPTGHVYLRAFSAEPFPRFAYQGDGWTIEKSLRLLPGENTAVLSYTLLGGHHPIQLEARPLFALRGIHELMCQWAGRLEAETRSPGHHRIGPTSRTPEVFFAHDGAFTAEMHWYLSNAYRREEQRGYNSLEDLWMPGAVQWQLKPGQTVNFVCSLEPIDLPRALAAAEQLALDAYATTATDSDIDALTHAADQFIAAIPPADTTAVITQYPWSPPSGRDALISFTGLFLVPGKFAQGLSLLQSIASHLDHGLLPSDFPEDGSAPLYRGADVSLWFINAVHDYVRYTGDEQSLRRDLFPVIETILQTYQHGARLGTGADGDGLLTSSVAGQATSWMDSKVSEWVVTPRQGRPVELNALWYNAIRIAAEFALRLGQSARADELGALAGSVKSAFNRRFWNEQANCCYDVIEDSGVDSSVRPNQLFAIALPYPVLTEDRFGAVLERVKGELLVPMGVRTLSPRDSNYCGHYAGNALARDRAAHQGSAYPWLLGAFVRAYLRVHGRSDQARLQAKGFIDPALHYLQNEGVGQLCELFDGDAPHRGGGAMAAARSVAELLRTYVEDILDRAPSPGSSLPAPAASLIPAPDAK